MSKVLPKDVMDYVAKSMAWLDGLIPNASLGIKEQIVNQGNKILEDYDIDQSDLIEIICVYEEPDF